MTDEVAAEGPPMRSQALVSSRAFALVDLGCALGAAALWYLSEGRLGFWPLLIAAVPWIVRAASGAAPLRRTRFDDWLFLFLVMALVGAWAGYSGPIAHAKFWLLAGALVLFYAMAAQPTSNIWTVATLFGYGGAAVSVYFLLTNDWNALPAKFAGIETLGAHWMTIRPGLLARTHSLHPNVAGGIVAFLFPLLLAAILRSFRKGNWPVAMLGAGAALVSLAGLALSASRGAWIALGSALVAWALWVAAGYLRRRLFLSRRVTLAVMLLVVAGLGLSAALLLSDGLAGALDRLPGPPSAGSRLVISRQSVDLIGDFPLTGGGLGSFDGLYSAYIRVIPNHALIHGHNVFLNLGLEQGLAGLAALLGLLATAFWILADPVHSHPRPGFRGLHLLSGALFAMLVVFCVHGLVDDPLYGSRGALLLFAPFGLTAAVFPHRGPGLATVGARDRRIRTAIGLAAGALLLSMLLFRRDILSVWESDLGSLEMARVELAGYPSSEWSDGSELALLAATEARFERAVTANGANRAALYRLGRIAMAQRDFPAAVEYLNRAYQTDPGHDGIRKLLGYNLVWSGQIEDGVELLQSVPDATAELDAYRWWWAQQGRPDIGEHAAQARQRLAELTRVP